MADTERRALACECCGMRPQVVKSAVVFGCSCMTELLCTRCNRCAKHCRCFGAQELSAPYPDQLAVIKYDLRSMGVEI